MSARVELLKYLPKVLGDDPYTMVAHEVHERLKEAGLNLTQATVRFNLSMMCKDPFSPVMRGRHGGYCNNPSFVEGVSSLDAKTVLDIKEKLTELKELSNRNMSEISINQYLTEIPNKVNEILALFGHE